MTPGPRRLRVCHLITTLDTGGAELMLARLVERMDASRFDTRVISLVPAGPVGASLQRAGIAVDDLGLVRGRPSPVAFATLVRRLRSYAPDVLQTWLYHADLMGLLAGRAAGIRHVLWNIRTSNMEMGHYRPLSTATLHACRLLSRFPDGIVVNSRVGQSHHARLGFRPRRWFLIPNGVDTDRFRPDPEAPGWFRAEHGLPPSAELVGFIARVDPAKDHETFLRAAALLARKRPDVYFVLAGERTLESSHLDLWIRDGDLVSRVLRLGRREDVPRIVAALDVATLVSRFGEGFPNVVAEALSAGVPCVVTNLGDAAELVGDLGVVVPPRDAHALAAAWARTLSLGADERAAIGRRARALVEEQYALSVAVARYESLYEAVAAGRP